MALRILQRQQEKSQIILFSLRKADTFQEKQVCQKTFLRIEKKSTLLSKHVSPYIPYTPQFSYVTRKILGIA